MTNIYYFFYYIVIFHLKQGFMSVPSPITKTGLSQETANKVNTFYHNEDISRTLPGQSDSVTVKVIGMKE